MKNDLQLETLISIETNRLAQKYKKDYRFARYYANYRTWQGQS